MVRCDMRNRKDKREQRKGESMKAWNLKTEHLTNPDLIDGSHPVLSWQCPFGVMQRAYRVQFFQDGEQIWDSGRTEGPQMQIEYPQVLPYRQTFTWRVQIWTDGDPEEHEEWSEAASFATGMEPDRWQAKWISPETEMEPDKRKPAGYLRKRFTVEASGSMPEEYAGQCSEHPGFRPEKAGHDSRRTRLYCTAHGLYTMYLNGIRVGADVLTPGSDEYGSRLCYQSYDITDLLREGENECIVVLGDGWYRGCNGIDGIRNLFGDDLSFLAQAERDGEILFLTDETWEGSQDGPIRMTDMELGEVYDASREQIAGWHPARVMQDFGYDNLMVSGSVPVRERETFEGQLICTPSGEAVFDFGQNLAGYTELTVDARAGQEIILIHGETLDEDGNFTIANFQPGERNQSGGIKQEIHYICKEGQNQYRPSFSIFGFRYVKVEGNVPAEKITLLAHAVYSDMKETARFTCGEAALNQLFSNSVWSMKSNFCDLPTDCPTRERAGWTGDAGVFAPTGSMLMDCYPVFRKWLANVRCNQHADGKMAYISPTNGKGSQISEMFSASVGWGDAAVLVPYALYQFYGDTKILSENYEMMRKWVDFLCERAKQVRENDPFDGNPYQEFIINTGMDYGEWCEPGANVMLTMQQAFANGQPEVATAYYAHSAGLLGEIAQVLGNAEDAEYYRSLSEQAKQAYRSFHITEGRIHSKRQCEYVRPLAFDLLDETEAKAAAQDLNDLVIKMDYHLNTGFLSTPYLCQVLAEYGYADTAYRLLLQRECPGWLYAVEKGATTIWETWDGIREDGTVHDSLNHYSYGAIAGWLISGVCGIRYTQDSLRIVPLPDRRLGYAEAALDSPRGRIVSGWAYDEVGNVRFHIVIPGNTEAKIVLPDGTVRDVESGEYHFELRQG